MQMKIMRPFFGRSDSCGAVSPVQGPHDRQTSGSAQDRSKDKPADTARKISGCFSDSVAQRMLSWSPKVTLWRVLRETAVRLGYGGIPSGCRAAG